jgi:hypothetical protein
MTDQARAAVAFEGSALRYAEVETVGNHARLLRLGACDFEFAPDEMLRAGNAEALAIVREAIGDVFEGSEASGLRVVLPPPGVLTWTAPFPPEQPVTERNARLKLETTLLAGADAAPGLNLTLQPLYRSDAFEWVQVVALPRPVQGRMEALGRTLSGGPTRPSLTLLGAARMAAACGSAEGLTVALGLFDARTEYVIVRGGDPVVLSSGKAERGPNALFSLLRLIDRLGAGAEAVQAAFVYGDAASAPDLDALPDVFTTPFAPLNPLRALLVDDPDAADAFEVSAYAPVVGAAL